MSDTNSTNGPADTSLPSQVGHYNLGEKIGQGGMAVVYKGLQSSLNRPVAIKVLPPQFATTPELLARFEREAAIVANLNHSNIVQVIDRGREGTILYIVMEYVEGQNLDKLIRAGRIPLPQIIDIVSQICEGLAYAHRSGVVHRDLKPANILVDQRMGRVKIADFGIAALESTDGGLLTLTVDHSVIGTMNYMSPEQRRDSHSVTTRTDIFSLGVILYEMLTGKLPVGHFKLPSMIRPDVPLGLDSIVKRCLAESPDDRYADAGQIRDELQSLTTRHTTPRSFSALGRLNKRQRWMALIAGAAAALVVLLGTALLVGHARSRRPAAGEPPGAVAIETPGGQAAETPSLTAARPPDGAAATVAPERPAVVANPSQPVVPPPSLQPATDPTPSQPAVVPSQPPAPPPVVSRPTVAPPSQPTVAPPSQPVVAPPSRAVVDARAKAELAKAQSLVNQEKLMDAITAFEELIRLYPKHALAAEAQFGVADAYERLPDRSRSVEEFGRLLQLYPDSARVPETTVRKCTIEFELGRQQRTFGSPVWDANLQDRLITELQAVLDKAATGPQAAPALALIARIAERPALAHPQAAAAALMKLYALAPAENADTLFHAAELYEESDGDRQRAIETYTRFIRDFPYDPRTAQAQRRLKSLRPKGE